MLASFEQAFRSRLIFNRGQSAKNDCGMYILPECIPGIEYYSWKKYYKKLS
jgi:hypothetical protein